MSTFTVLQDILAQEFKVDREKLELDTQLSALGVDSLGLLELMFKVEDAFHLKIVDDPPNNLATIQDVCTYIDSLLARRP